MVMGDQVSHSSGGFDWIDMSETQFPRNMMLTRNTGIHTHMVHKTLQVFITVAYT